MEQNSEQEADDALVHFLPSPSNSPELQQKRKLPLQTGSGLREPPGQPAAHCRSARSASPHLNTVAAEGSSSSEKGGKDFMNPFHVTSAADREKDIALLLNELDFLRSHNRKLQENLSAKEKELKALKLDLELHERAAEASSAGEAAALVEEVRSAQRHRDEAVTARLKLANEERDQARKRVQQLEQSFETLENINPEENDMTLQELLNRVNNADTGMAIRKNGARIVDRISRTREQKRKIIAEEMNVVMEERDAAVAQNPKNESEDVSQRSGHFYMGFVAVLICSTFLSQFLFHQIL